MYSVVLSNTEISHTQEFATELVMVGGQNMQNGRSDQVRSPNRVIASNVMGKLAEVAVSKFFGEELGAPFTPNFDVYASPYITDGGSDIPSLNGFKSDIKSLLAYSTWVSLFPDVIDKKKANAFIFAKVGLSRNYHESLVPPDYIIVDICGYLAHGDWFRPDGEVWFDFPAGSHMYHHKFRRPDPSNRVKQMWQEYNSVDWNKAKRLKNPILTNKYGMPMEWLRWTKSEWLTLVHNINIPVPVA